MCFEIPESICGQKPQFPKEDRKSLKIDESDSFFELFLGSENPQLEWLWSWERAQAKARCVSIFLSRSTFWLPFSTSCCIFCAQRRLWPLFKATACLRRPFRASSSPYEVTEAATKRKTYQNWEVWVKGDETSNVKSKWYKNTSCKNSKILDTI